MTDSPPRMTLPFKGRRQEYDQAASWAADVHGGLRASRRVAWTIAAVAVGIAGLEAIALATLTPLKTVTPYTILVDRQTGYVETVRALAPGALTADNAVTESFLVQYVIARETFDATDLRENYRKVGLWSDGPARAAYQRDMARTNPGSPLAIYPPTSIVAVTIKSVSLLSPTTALVRFDTTRRDAGASVGEQRAWQAVLAFRYTGAPLRNEDRFVNPLGFQVTRYRRDAEAVQPSQVRFDTPPAAFGQGIAPSAPLGPAIAPTTVTLP